MTFFLVIDQVFRIFPFFSQIFRIFTMLNVVYDPHKKNHYFIKEFLFDTFFTLFVHSRASDNTTSQNIGGTDAWAVPPPQILGDHPPSPSRSPPLGKRNGRRWEGNEAGKGRGSVEIGGLTFSSIQPIISS